MTEQDLVQLQEGGRMEQIICIKVLSQLILEGGEGGMGACAQGKKGVGEGMHFLASKKREAFLLDERCSANRHQKRGHRKTKGL